MRKHLLRYFFRLEYLIGSIAVVVMVQGLVLLSDAVPEADETSFLSPILDRIEFINITDVSLDAIFAVKHAEFPDARIKIINLGQVAPTPDGKIAMLLHKLHNLGAAVVGVDVFFDDQHFERFPPERAEEVEALIDAMHAVPNVVLVNAFDPRTGNEAFALDPRVGDSKAQFGFANLVPDPDGVVRRFLPHAQVNGERWLSFPLRLLSVAAPATIEHILRLPSEPQIIYYAATYDQFEIAPIDDVLFGTMYDAGYFRDAIVLVGVVNEAGWYYLNDTHTTPMGEKDDREGPDMPGVLVHANVVNMLLSGSFITPVPAWGDWLLVFLFSYVSIALYRVLRTKPASRTQVGLMITTMLTTQAVIVFFLPLIAFFYFDVKISYHLMATAMLLYIPANAMTTTARFRLLERRVRREFTACPNPLPQLLRTALTDDAPFPANIRLVYSGVVLLQFSWALRLAEARAAGQAPTRGDLLPGFDAWRQRVPELRAAIDVGTPGAEETRYFLRFLFGKKDEFLRESLLRESFFSTELQGFNEFVFFEEWEVLLPRMLALWTQLLRSYVETDIVQRHDDGRVTGLVEGGAVADSVRAALRGEQTTGLFGTLSRHDSALVRLSPFCTWTECKLHRTPEFFVFAGLLPKQRALPLVPAYFGPTPNCEPILRERCIDELREFEHNAIPIERSTP
ncbi:MAG: CHASE2 domain-containing protein [Bacteroidota bacterium]|jgi:CHASE2 domain-containing sensor protein|nr:CHASE2 domain-containing protein [Bacteroidota bacterium]